jgi:hypothetical protein
MAGCPVTLTGFVNPNYATGTYFYYFYDWVITEGCKSNRVPVTAVVNSLPAVPSITPVWNTLTSSSPTGNQWYLNGVAIPGATGQTYVATQAGTYTVVVTDANGCSSNASQPVFTTGLEEMLNQTGVAVYPNPVSDQFMVELSHPASGTTDYKVYNMVGALVKTGKLNGRRTSINCSNLGTGTYLLEVQLESGVVRTRIVKQ